MNKCKTCALRWFGNHISPNFAQWYCRLDGFKLIGESGTEKELNTKGCGNWKRIVGH